MKFFAIADLHLGQGLDKPMHKFGRHWEDHEKKIWANCREKVGSKDILVLAGDLSWAINLDEAAEDLAYMAGLPGQKILLRGNHDYWWSTRKKNLTQLDRLGLQGLHFLQNNAFRIWSQAGRTCLVDSLESDLVYLDGDEQLDKELFERLYGPICEPGLVLVGSRGWCLPQDPQWDKEKDPTILARELGRLQNSLKAGEQLARPGDVWFATTHFPPFGRDLKATDFTRTLSLAGIKKCFFGHVHNRFSRQVVHGLDLDGVVYSICACDQVDFSPLELGLTF